MLIGAHVGGLRTAIERGEAVGAAAIQIFSQSPRMWRPTSFSEEELAEFRAALAASSTIEQVVIHAVYLLNCGSEEADLRKKSRTSLAHALRVGAGIGAVGVVLHAGSAKKGDVGAAIKRAGKTIADAISDSEQCPVLLEDTAGAGGTLGRSFEELAAMLEAAGGDGRLGICLDSCHLLASGYDIRAAEGLAETIDEYDRVVGCDRLTCLHINDSVMPLGSNRDRHTALGEGEIGKKGCAAFLSEPRFEGLPVIFEGPGVAGKAPTAEDMKIAHRLRKTGLKARGR